MPDYYLKISDGTEAETVITEPNAHQAVNSALNAMATFACRRFPPPHKIAITVMDAHRHRVATLKFDFTIDYAESFRT